MQKIHIHVVLKLDQKYNFNKHSNFTYLCTSDHKLKIWTNAEKQQ